MKNLSRISVVIFGAVVDLKVDCTNPDAPVATVVDGHHVFEGLFIRRVKFEVENYFAVLKVIPEFFTLGLRGDHTNFKLVPIEVLDDRAPNTIGALQYYLTEYGVDDRLVFEDQLFDGEPGDLNTPYLDDDYTDVELSNGGLGREIRICANLSDEQLAKKEGFKLSLTELISYNLEDEDADLVGLIEDGDLDAVKDHVMKHLILLQGELDEGISEVGSFGKLGNTAEEVWANILKLAAIHEEGADLEITPKDGYPEREFNGSYEGSYTLDKDVLRICVVDGDGDCFNVELDQIEVAG